MSRMTGLRCDNCRTLHRGKILEPYSHGEHSWFYAELGVCRFYSDLPPTPSNTQSIVMPTRLLILALEDLGFSVTRRKRGRP